MAECQNCGSDQDIAIDNYGIVVCCECVDDDTAPELVDAYREQCGEDVREKHLEDRR